MSEIIENAKPTELTPSELDLVSGGLTLNFTKIAWTYTQQKPDGSGSQESRK
jgi:type VI protein secretion system component Hcp